MITFTNLLLVLVMLLVQLCEGENKYCQKAVESLVIVASCPTSSEDWAHAANIKNCTEMATRQNCTTADKFVYHCVINGYRNETLEVCAPERYIHGYCTEFNVVGGIIQSHVSVRCNDIFPKCDRVYQSSVAYRYPDCYELVYNKGKYELTTIAPPGNTTYGKTESGNRTKLVAITVSVVLTICAVLVIAAVLIIRKQKRDKGIHTKDIKTEDELHELISESCDISEEQKREKAIHTKDIKTEEELHGFISESCDISEERKPNRRNVTEAETTTDKYNFAVCKTEEDYRNENKDESQKFLNLYKVMDKYFVETAKYKEAEKTFSKSGIVIFTGPPGCGKTISAIHLIWKQLQLSKKVTFRKIRSLEELSYMENDEQSIILIDNIFYRRTMDLRLEHWWEKLEEIHNKDFAGNENEIGLYSGRLRIVMTARPKVVKRACDYMGKVTPILNETFIINANKLSEQEKEDIFANQIKFAETEKHVSENIFSSMGADFKRQVRKSEGPIGFPLCAHLFVCGKDYRKSGVSFFSSPIEYLKVQIKDEIESDKTNKSKSLFFYIFFNEWHVKMGKFEISDIKSNSHCRRFLDRISTDLVANFGPLDFSELDDEAKRLSGAFFKEVSDHVYKFIHDSVYDAVGAYFCETFVIKTAKFFPLDIILNQSFEKISDKGSRTLASRLLYEAVNQRLSEVFSCKILRQKPFAELFCTELRKKEPETIDNILTIPNESTAVKLPSMFWASFYNLTNMTEHLYNIVNERNLDLQYHFYVSLYGMCCAKDESLLKTTNGMLRDNFEKIKERVLKFNDREGNHIQHLIITSDCSDVFASVAIRKLLVEKEISPDERNGSRVTPIMFAVESKWSRTEVIRTLVEFAATLRYKDRTGSTVLHHCLGSCNDDETCANYLNILLPENDNTDWLSKDDENGDTALSIAASCSKHSRLKSICLLLKKCVKINILNEDGYSPLHLSVRSLTEKNDHFELECCTRVIILILNGADPNKKSDKNHKAIDECQYKIVKDVLRNPEDMHTMENALECLLKKFKKCKEKLELSEIFSANMNEKLKEYVSKAIQILQNVNFDHISSQSTL